VTRYYILRDNFLYAFDKEEDTQPRRVIYLEGAFVEVCECVCGV